MSETNGMEGAWDTREQASVGMEFAEACRTERTEAGVYEIAVRMGGLISPRGFNMSDYYPLSSVDVIVRKEDVLARVFVHPRIDPGLTSAGEELLDDAVLPHFTVLDETEHFVFRAMPLFTQALLSHRLTSRTAETIGRSFLVPALQGLYQKRHVVPSPTTMTALAHSEKLETRNGTDSVTTGMYFLPPYEFNWVTPETFMATVQTNTAMYGPHVQAVLAKELIV